MPYEHETEATTMIQGPGEATEGLKAVFPEATPPSTHPLMEFEERGLYPG